MLKLTQASLLLISWQEAASPLSLTCTLPASRVPSTDWKYGWVCGSSSQNPDSKTCGGPRGPEFPIIWPILVLNMINKLFIDFIVLPNLIVRLNDPQPPYPVSSLPRTGLLVCVCTLTHTQKAARQVSPVCCDSCSVDAELGDKNISLLTGDYWGPALPAPGEQTWTAAYRKKAPQYSVNGKRSISTSGSWPLTPLTPSLNCFYA